MDELKKNRELIINKINKFNEKVFSLQNQLLNIEQQIVDTDHKEIMNSLTLNEQQLKVVNSKDLYTLVIACPGSGKTHTLISMYIKLIVEDKIDSDNVIMITFTKKAGQEMCGRLSSLIPTKLPSYVGSLHGLAYRILQEYYNINYTILDDKETKDILKDLSNIYLDPEDKIKVAYIIDKASSNYPFELSTTLKKLNLESKLDKIQILYDKYKEKKKNENLVDFNDLMLLFCEFLDKKESDTFKNKIQFIFFDEYQDINPIQHYILKSLKKSRIMVVGDDAQAIYAFRGSSVDYILKFPKEFKIKKMYLLEKNYRSTKQIVEFFQDIIIKNTNQYEKDVVSVNVNEGMKPIVIGFKNHKEKEQWIINEIFANKNKGISLSKMVILARTNESLDKIEIELVKQGITVIKHTGLSILDKSHVKDFLAFLTVLVNEKSSIHWKRILSLQLGVNQAHEIISNCHNTNFKELIKKLKDTQVPYANYLKEIDGLFNVINKTQKDVDKGRYILSYLEKLWLYKNKAEEKVKDINLLLSYLSGTNLKQFLGDLYLNQSIEVNLDNVIYLTTIHGSKGLEWDYVYLIDVDSDNFPKINHGFFKQECEEIEEERRLFYVACSRAKTNLIITYNYNLNPSECVNMSPFIREINSELFTLIGENIKNPYQMNGMVSFDTNNFLKYFGFSKIYPLIKNIVYEKENMHSGFEIPKYFDKYKNTRAIINKFMNLLISKIIHINFTKKVKCFHKLEKIPEKIRQNYLDELNDWRNLLEDIFFISTFNLKDDEDIFNELKSFLTNSKAEEYYNILATSLCKKLNKKETKIKEININYNISNANVKGTIDILIDDTIFEIKSNSYEIVTTSNLLELLIYGYLCQKKDKKINNIILYNPLSGENTKFNVEDFNFKELANIVYGVFKTN